MKDQLIAVLRDMCKCNISSLNIQEDVFGCGQLNHLITYRGRLLGTSNYNALGLVELMQSWISTNQAHLTIDSFRMQLDPACNTRLDTINAPDCPLGGTVTPPTTEAITTKAVTTKAVTTPATKPDTTKPGTVKTDVTQPKPNAVTSLSSSIRTGEAAGVFIGVVIVILLITLLVLIVGVILYKRRKFPKISRSGNMISNIIWIISPGAYFLK